MIFLLLNISISLNFNILFDILYYRHRWAWIIQWRPYYYAARVTSSAWRIWEKTRTRKIVQEALGYQLSKRRRKTERTICGIYLMSLISLLMKRFAILKWGKANWLFNMIYLLSYNILDIVQVLLAPPSVAVRQESTGFWQTEPALSTSAEIACGINAEHRRWGRIL